MSEKWHNSIVPRKFVIMGGLLSQLSQIGKYYGRLGVMFF